MYIVAKVGTFCVRHTMTVNTAVDRPREKDGDDTGILSAEETDSVIAT